MKVPTLVLILQTIFELNQYKLPGDVWDSTLPIDLQTLKKAIYIFWTYTADEGCKSSKMSLHFVVGCLSGLWILLSKNWMRMTLSLQHGILYFAGLLTSYR